MGKLKVIKKEVEKEVVPVKAGQIRMGYGERPVLIGENPIYKEFSIIYLDDIFTVYTNLKNIDIEEIYPFTLKSTLIKHNSNL